MASKTVKATGLHIHQILKIPQDRAPAFTPIRIALPTESPAPLPARISAAPKTFADRFRKKRHYAPIRDIAVSSKGLSKIEAQKMLDKKTKGPPKKVIFFRQAL